MCSLLAEISSLLSYSEVVYVYLDWFVYKILRTLRMARSMLQLNFSVHMPLLSVIHSGLPILGHMP